MTEPLNTSKNGDKTVDKPDATAHFRGTERNNCAQAVLKAYAAHAGVDQGCVQRFSQFGSGRAPAGECGALFAAKSLLQDESAKRSLEAAFILAAGSAQCRKIRGLGRLSCRQCVQTAADEIFVRLSEGQALQRPANCEG
ncbi:MAG: hypothetical protein NTY19_42540 [Planctomycetota bacterium]|nr:hypothetical protein [Planctomycetota bacterium]